MPKLYADINGIAQPMNISVNSSHNNATAMATISCISTTLDVGDPIEIDLGLTDDHTNIFEGWVKGVDRQVPENIYTITAQDKMVQAIDYFIVAPSPDSPYNYGKGISAEDLVEEVLGLADLTLDHIDATYFTFGVNNDVEVNLVSAYDYAKMIADVVTWGLWCDKNGEIHFENRKPFVMGVEDYGQPGWTPDTSVNAGNPFTDIRIIDFTHKRSEKDLRNKVVVYGESGITASKSRATSYDPSTGGYIQVLPDGFFKSVIVSYGFIGSQEIADNSAQYNLDKLNRIGEQVSIQMTGNPSLEARQVITIQEDITGLGQSDWYIYTLDHSWSKEGFITSMELRR